MDPSQNISQPVNQPMTSPAQGTSMGNGHRKVGPIVATLIIVLVLIIAALYLFASRLNQQAAPADTTATSEVDLTATATQSVQPITNTANDPQSLQNDLNKATNGLDSQNF